MEMILIGFISDQPQATYVNMFELATMAANRAQGLQLNNSNVDHGHTVHEKVHVLNNVFIIKYNFLIKFS